MLRNELIKILSSKTLIVVIVIALMLNGGLIYWQQLRADECNGVTYEEYNHISKDMRDMSDVEKETYLQEKLELLSLIREFEIYLYYPEEFGDYFQGKDMEEIREIYESGGYIEYTDNIYDEESLCQEMLAEVEEVLSYPTVLDSIKKNSEKILRRLSEGTYQYERARKSLETYDELGNIEPYHQPVRGIELFMDNVTTDMLVVICLLFAVVIAVTYEREKNLMILSKSTKNGRVRHAAIKVLALLVIGMIVALILYGETFIIAECIYDLGDMTRPIQSVAGYSLCAMEVSVWEYIVIYIGIKFLFFFMCIGLFFLFSCIFRRGYMVYLVSGGLIAALVAIYNAISDTSYLVNIKIFNPVSYGQVEQMLSRYQCIDIGGYAYEKTSVLVTCTILFMAVAFAIGICVYARSNEKEVATFGGFTFRKRQRLHTSLIRHELHKIYVAYGVGLVHIIGLVAAYMVFTPASEIHYSDDDYYYSMYSSKVEGEYSERVDEYIGKQIAFVDGKLEEYGDRPTSSEYLSYEMARESLLDMQTYADYLKDKTGSYYIHNGGYKLLTGGTEAIDTQNVIIAVVSSVFAIVCFTLSMSADYERGEDRLIRSTLHGRRKYVMCKVLIGALSGTLLYATFWLPQLISILQEHGVAYIGAPAYSLEHLGWLPSWVSIVGYITLIFAIRYVGIMLIMLASYILVKRLRSSAVAMMVAVAIFILPLILWVLGVEEMRYITPFCI